MELRKTPKFDLESRRGMFFNIGLAISLALTLTAFEWTSYESALVVFEPQEDEFEPMYDVPLTVVPPPPPPPIEQPIIVEVPDVVEIEKDAEVNFDTELDESDIIEIIEFDAPEPEVIIDAPVDFAEYMPEPLNGMKEYYKFISRNMKYPNQARRMGIEGKVFVQFIINKEGEITDIKTVKGIGAGCDLEAERVLALSSKWKPGRQGARRVSVRMILPIQFSLQ